MVGVRAPFLVFSNTINLAFFVWVGFVEAVIGVLMLAGFLSGEFAGIGFVIFVILFSIQLAQAFPEPCTE